MFVDSLPPDTRKVVVALREVVQTTVPDAEESVLWGALSYHRPWIGGRIKGSVCQISFKAGEVRLEFVHGIRIVDRHKMLRGSRVSKRYVSVRTLAEARRPEIAELVAKASTLDFTDTV